MRGDAVALVFLVGCLGSGSEPVVDGDRVLERNAGSCRIGQTTYPAGAVNPANPCELCTPSLSKKVWSSAPDGSWCNDGNACTGTDSCSAGTCSPGPVLGCDDGDECTADSCNANSGCFSVVDEACLAAADMAVGPLEATPLSPLAGATGEVVVPIANVGILDAEGVELFVTFAATLSVDPAGIYFETAGWSTGAFSSVTQANGATTLHFDKLVVSSNPPGLIPTAAAGRLRLGVRVDGDLPPGTHLSVSANAVTTSRERVLDNNSDNLVLTAAP